MPTVNETLPADLLAEMTKPRDKRAPTAHSLALVYCDHCGPATVDELLVYIWNVTGEAKTRDYLYHVLKRLRDRGYLERVELESEVVIRHMLTPDGEHYLSTHKLQYIKPKGNKPQVIKPKAKR